MEEVARYPGLMLRGSKWYLRMRVPKDLVATIGKREIWRSLRTGDHRKARALYFDKRAALEREFAALREGPGQLDDARMRQMVLDWFGQHDRQLAEACFSTHGPDRHEALAEAERELAQILNGDHEEVSASVLSTVPPNSCPEWLAREGAKRADPASDLHQGCGHGYRLRCVSDPLNLCAAGDDRG